MFATVSSRQTAVTFIHTSVQHYVIHKQLLLQRDKNSTLTAARRRGESEDVRWPQQLLLLLPLETSGPAPELKQTAHWEMSR